MQRFVHEQNLTHFIELLEFEADPAKREQLHRLLLEEVDRFGNLSERLNEVDRLLVRCTGRLHDQRAPANRLLEDGHDDARSQDFLAHVSQTLQLIAEYRLTLVERLDHSES